MTPPHPLKASVDAGTHLRLFRSSLPEMAVGKSAFCDGGYAGNGSPRWAPRYTRSTRGKRSDYTLRGLPVGSTPARRKLFRLSVETFCLSGTMPGALLVCSRASRIL